MIDLSVGALKDFQTCALLYDFRHVQERYEPLARENELARRFENTIKNVVTFFFYKRQSGQIPSVSALVNRWEKYWFPKDMSAYDLAVEQHDTEANLASYSSEAVRSLLRFYEDFAGDIKNDPMLLNEDFIVPIGDITLHGNFDLVLRDQKGVITVIKWLTSQKRIPVSSMMLDFAALKMGLDYRNDGKRMPVRYGYYDLISAGKFGYNEVQVPDADVNALIYWAQEAAAAQVYAPRRGLTSYCRGCPFDAPCKQFTMTDKMLEIQRNETRVSIG